MVFSSVPMFLDPPNWPPQQPNHFQGSGCETNNNNTQHLPPPPPPAGGGGSGNDGGNSGGGGPGSIRPGSMTDRARMAKIPQPEAGLKCPRCESTNTKFCYFNNYSLTQPRHFCKTCRRYWTRGGAMRNVPVGGGCRRSSKRSSKGGGSNRSKSPAGSSTSTSTVSSNSCTTDIISQQLGATPSHNLPFLPPNLNHNHHHHHHHQLSDSFGNIGLNFEGLQIPNSNNNSSLPSSSSATADHHHQSSNILLNISDHQWTKIPFFANLHQQNGMYSNLMGEEGDFSNYQRLSKPLFESGFGSTANIHQAGINNNFSRNFLGIQPNIDHQFWSNSTATTTAGNNNNNNNIGWTDQISDHHFHSTSSTTHHLL